MTEQQDKPVNAKFKDVGTVTQAELKAIFHYDPETGVFTRLKKHRYPVAGSTKGVEGGYIRMCIKRKCYVLHRLAWLYVYGRFPTEAIDHINGDKLDNRFLNLREASHAQNMRNIGWRKDSKAVLKNVYFIPSKNLYKVKMKVGAKPKILAYSEDIEFAELIAIEARNLYHGAFANHG